MLFSSCRVYNYELSTTGDFAGIAGTVQLASFVRFSRAYFEGVQVSNALGQPNFFLAKNRVLLGSFFTNSTSRQLHRCTNNKLYQGLYYVSPMQSRNLQPSKTFWNIQLTNSPQETTIFYTVYYNSMCLVAHLIFSSRYVEAHSFSAQLNCSGYTGNRGAANDITLHLLTG